MEEAQYVRARATSDLGPDATIMLRHDRRTLRKLPLRRQVAALFAERPACGDHERDRDRAGRRRFPRPARRGRRRLQCVGRPCRPYRRTGRGSTSPALAAIVPDHPTAAADPHRLRHRAGDRFPALGARHGVRAIGGLPTGFIDSPITDDAAWPRSARSTATQGAAFLELPNRSRYPRSAFFDTQDHLNEAAQISHSAAIAAGTGPAYGPAMGTLAVTGQPAAALPRGGCAPAPPPRVASDRGDIADRQHARYPAPAAILENLSDEQRDAISEVLWTSGSCSNPRVMSANTQYLDSPARVMQVSSARNPTRGGTADGQGMRLFTAVSASAGNRMRAANRSWLAVSAIR